MLDTRLLGWLAAALAALIAIAYVAWLSRRKGRGGTVQEVDRIDTIGGWPPQVTRLLTPTERLAFSTLVRALPEYIVLSQVPLARFIDVPKRNSYAEWLRRVGNQSVDFLICDTNSQIIAVVDVQAPPAQTNPRSGKRQARIARTLKAARVPFHVWHAASLPPVELARDSILGVPAKLESGPMPLADTALADRDSAATAVPRPLVTGRPAANPFDDTARDSTQDELIEAQEPPPSTWYDELDSGPTPLAGNKRPKR